MFMGSVKKTISIMSDEKDVKDENNTENGHSWTFFFTYVVTCVLLVFWLIYKFFRGRNQMRLAFVTIEQQLQRMQQQLELRQMHGELNMLKNSLNEVPEDTEGMEEKIKEVQQDLGNLFENENEKSKDD